MLYQMIYQVYQIRLNKEEIALINSTGDHAAVPANALKQKMSFAMGRLGGYAAEAWDAGYYTHVANITAEDYDQVFEIGNIGPEQNIERISQMHSVSVGDMIIAEDGTQVVVADFGFIAIGHKPEMVAA
tara:strand:- start:530 stop:916 length:387 start_codon:yes stop_codon:yes gene_type:complete